MSPRRQAIPAVPVAVGFSPERLPLAIELAGRPWGEAELLATAAWCEETLAFDPGEPPVMG